MRDTPSRHDLIMEIGDIDERQVIPRLRGDRSSRPLVDSCFAGGLRECLEDSVPVLLGQMGPEAPALRLSAEALARALHTGAPGGGVAEDGVRDGDGVQAPAGAQGPSEDGDQAVVARMVRVLFRQWVTAVQVQDPFGDALNALEASGDGSEVVKYLRSITAGRREALVAQLQGHVERIEADWPTIEASWLPRTDQELVVMAGGGRLVLSGVAGLVLGSPTARRASVCIVEAEPGEPSQVHRSRMSILALLQTLHSGAAPFRVATYHSSTGELDIEDVTEEGLRETLAALVDAIGRLCEGGAGGAGPAAEAGSEDGCGMGARYRSLGCDGALPLTRPQRCATGRPIAAQPSSATVPTGLAVALPRAPLVTEALLGPSQGAVTAEAFNTCRERLLGSLPPLAALLVRGAGVRLDSFGLGALLEDPDRYRPPVKPFVPTPAKARRSVGLAALAACMGNDTMYPAEAVSKVLAEAQQASVTGDASGTAARVRASSPAWWVPWAGRLSPGSLGVLKATATTWATALWSAVDWHAFTLGPVLGGPDDWWNCPQPGRFSGRLPGRLSLRGRAEARFEVEGRQRLLVVPGGAPGRFWRVELGLPALVAGLACGPGALPDRVVGIWPATGQVRVLGVDPALLVEVADAVVRATANMVGAQRAACTSFRPSSIPPAAASARPASRVQAVA
ncbi:MAG: hypothetical protein ACYCTL_12260 [Acidimicrobiales bacterium]